MPARQEIEDMLDAQAWAKRNGLDEPVYLPPAEMLREHELRTYRDCPEPDAYDKLPLVPLSLWPWLLAMAALFVIAFTWTWNNTWGS